VIPVGFGYARPDSLDGALALLAPATGLHFERRGRTVVVGGERGGDR
jgi:hypothetical protein